MSEGWGYEVTSADVVEAYDRGMDAASSLNQVDAVYSRIRQLIDPKENAAASFVRQSLQASKYGCAGFTDQISVSV